MRITTLSKLIIVFTGCCILACNIGGGADGDSKDIFRPAKGDRVYGGTMKLNELEFFSLYPPSIIYSIPAQIASQIFETLVRVDQSSLRVVPSLAESWEIDESGTNYTFKLRKGVKYHDDECFPDGKGREIKASDVKMCFEMLCGDQTYSTGYTYVFKGNVVGADAYRARVAAGEDAGEVEGIEVVDDYTLVIKLLSPSSRFLFTLALPFYYIFPEEGYAKYGEDVLVGTGPFQVAQLEENKVLRLARNNNYYRFDSLGNQLPFLDSVVISFIPEMLEEVKNFKAGRIDVIDDLTTDQIIEILEVPFSSDNVAIREYVQQRTPLMTTMAYEFLTQGSVFENRDLRIAFSYAVDRQLILDKVLDGEAYAAGRHGYNPPVIPGYDAASIEGYKFDVTKAKEHLKLAGYKDGADLGVITMDVNRSGGRNESIAAELKRQLKAHLNVDIEINLLSKKDKIEKQKSGKSIMYNREFTADYPSPSSFLNLLHGRDVPADMKQVSYPNTARYQSAEFDEYFEKAISTVSIDESNEYYLEAEKIAASDAPYIVLVYAEGYRIVQPYVMNFPNNALKVRDFSEVWFDSKLYESLSKVQVEEDDLQQ